MASQEQKDRLSQAAALINSILSPSAVQNIAASATVQPPVTARHVSVEGEITTFFALEPLYEQQCLRCQNSGNQIVSDYAKTLDRGEQPAGGRGEHTNML